MGHFAPDATWEEVELGATCLVGPSVGALAPAKGPTDVSGWPP
jgi:hypothetical protein